MVNLRNTQQTSTLLVSRDVETSSKSTISTSGTSTSTTNTSQPLMSFGSEWNKDMGGRQASQYQQRYTSDDGPSGRTETIKRSMADEDDVDNRPPFIALDFGLAFPSSLYQHHAENDSGVSKYSLVRDLNADITVGSGHLSPTQDSQSGLPREENCGMRVDEKGKAVFKPLPSRSKSIDTLEKDPREVCDNHQTNSPVVSAPLSPESLEQNTQRSTTAEPQGAPGEDATIDCYEYDVPNPKFIYPFKGVSGLYVGFEDKIKPPKAQLEKWRSDVYPRLWVDLREFQNRMKTRKKGRGTAPSLSLELRMSGYVARGSKRVALSPRIWILYDRHRWRNDIRTFFDEIDWLSGEGFGSVEILKGCPQLCALDKPQIIEDLFFDPLKAFRLTDEVALHLHVEQPKYDHSACGLICCATLTKKDTIISQQLSRIGGLLSVDGKPLGITTAHVMHRHVEAIFHQEMDLSREGSYNYEHSDSESSTDDESDHTPGDDEDVSTVFMSRQWDKPLGQVNVQDIFEWAPVYEVGPTGFLSASGADLNQFIELLLQGHRKPNIKRPSTDFKPLVSYGAGTSRILPCDSTKSLESPAADTDFTLCNIPISQLQNTFGVNGMDWTKITSISNSAHLSEGPVQLVLRSHEVVEGQLLPGNVVFSHRGVEFETMKLRISAPLAKGCSGCWVIRGHVFCGMIIAAYQSEPYAHMVTSPKLISDIMASTSTIKSIGLPTEFMPTQARGIPYVPRAISHTPPPESFPFHQRANIPYRGASSGPDTNTESYFSKGRISFKGEWAVLTNGEYRVIEDFNPIDVSDVNSEFEWSEVDEGVVIDESSSDGEDWEDWEVRGKSATDESQRVDFKENSLPRRPPVKDSQAFGNKYRNIVLAQPLPDKIEGAIGEEAWGYLFPVDARYRETYIVMRDQLPPSIPSFTPEVVSSSSRKGYNEVTLRKGASLDRDGAARIPFGKYLIGRHIECDIVVNHPTMSDRHYLLFAEYKGGIINVMLEDLSDDGTFVNNVLVGRNQRKVLEEGDEVSVLGGAQFVFRYPKSRAINYFLAKYSLFPKNRLCVERVTGKAYAVKEVSKTQRMRKKSRTKDFYREMAALRRVSHPNVLCLKDIFNGSNSICLVFELTYNGDLFGFMTTHSKLSEIDCRCILTQLLGGVNYLHSRNIIHRDIKPENTVFVDGVSHVKLANFEAATIIGEDTFITALRSVPNYVAPEILTNDTSPKYTKAVDTWSLGVLLYVCLCGLPPFSDGLYSEDFPYTLLQQIRSGRFNYPSPYWDSVDGLALELIDSMLIVDTEKRFTIDECLVHPWITKKTTHVESSNSAVVESATPETN